jgi:hypothetical protein
MFKNMKKNSILVVLVIGLLSIFQLAEGKIWRTNAYSNYNGINLWGDNYGGSETYPVFKNVEQAEAVAQNGDTVYVEPGTYPNFQLTRRLTIIGPGYFHTTGLSYRASNAWFQGIRFEDGAEGSRLIGISYASGASSIVISCSDITIERCWIENAGVSLIVPIDNIKVISCFFGPSPNLNPSNNSGDSFNESFSSSNPVTNMEVSNCIFRCPIRILNTTLDKFNNNTLELPYLNNVASLQIKASKCYNNIIKRASNISGTNTPTIQVTSDSIKNCISYAAGQFGNNAALGNILFTTIGQQNALYLNQTGSTDVVFRLSPAYLPGTANPVSNLGTDGTQRGAFGGEYPYSLSGLGPIPVVKDIVTNGTNTPGQGINLKISAGTVK